MHKQQTKDRFIELRIEGKSLRGIADELKISKNTVCEWNIEFGAQIIEAQRMAMEAAMEELLVDPITRVKNIATIYTELHDQILSKRESQSRMGTKQYHVNFEPLLEIDAHLRKIMPALPRQPHRAAEPSPKPEPSNPA